MATVQEIQKFQEILFPADRDLDDETLIEEFRKKFTHETYSHNDRHGTKGMDRYASQVDALNRMLEGRPLNPGNFADTRRVQKTVEGNYISDYEGWSATMELMYDRAGEIVDWLNNPDTQEGDTISLTANVGTASDEYEHLGQGFLTDRNGFLHEYDTDYTCAVLRRDTTMPNGFQIRTRYDGAGKEYKEQCSDKELADIYQLSNDSVAEYMKETNYFKSAPPAEKGYLLYISDSSNPYKCRLYSERDGSQYIVMKEPLPASEDGHRMEHRLTISERGLQLNLYRDESTPTDTKPNWRKIPVPEAKDIIGRDSIFLKLNKPEQVAQFLELSPETKLLYDTGLAIQKDIRSYSPRGLNREKILQDAANIQPAETLQPSADVELSN